MNEKAYKFIGGMAGLILGFSIPLVCFLIRALSLHSFSQIIGELGTNGFFYSYMLCTIPLSLTAFGLYFGSLRDEVFEQKLSLENLNRALEIRQSSLENTNDVLQSQAVMDPLTGLYNRRYVLIELEKEVERARRQKFVKPILYAMMIDVDNFKRVNDVYGHNAGDYVLREVANIIRRSIRKIDIGGRYAGDEFIVILPEANYDAALVVAERLQKNIREQKFEFENGALNVTLSIGVAPFDCFEFIDTKTFIEKVDWSMLTAKREGKNRIVMSKLD